MAKQRFDVNTTIKLLETTKQFVGGLKTVDTDDALGSFFLRDAENISLSEYGFIEKRYGLIDNGDLQFSGVSLGKLSPATENGRVQGYFEYTRRDGFIDQILFVNGRLFLARADDNQVTVPDIIDGRFHQVTSFAKKDGEFYINEDIFNNYLQTFVLNPTKFSFQTQVQTFDNFDDLFLGVEEIEAVRIEDKLYIFNGVYPLTYEGDGNFYLLQEFVPSFTELKVFSHNIHNADNAEYYSDISDTEDISDGKFLPTSDPNIVFEFVDEVAYPRLPYTNKEGTIFTAEIAYSLHRSLLPPTNFVSFLDATTPRTEANGGIFAEIAPRVYYRPSGTGASNLEWLEIPKDSLVYTHRTNFDDSQYTVSTFKTYNTNDKPNFIDYPGGINYFIFDYEFQSTRAKKEPISSTDPYKVEIQNMPEGSYDIRVDLVLQKTGYRSTGEGDLTFTRSTAEENKVITRVYRDITFTKEQLQDYLEIDPAGLWTCNRVINHYGKLMAYGSRINPQTVYVGHPTYKEYFPEFFTLDFETDDKQEIQKITPFMNILVVQSESFTWGLKGTDALIDSENPYSQFTINPIYGTIAPKSVRPVRNQLYFLSREGLVSLNSLFANDSQYNVKRIDENIENIVPLDREAVAIQFDNQYWIHFPNTKNNMTLRYYIDNKSWVKDTYFEWNGLDNDGEPEYSDTVFNGIHKYIRKDGDLYFITNLMRKDGENNFNVKKLMIDESMPTDLGEAPKTMFETAYMNQGYPFHPKKYLENRFDFTIQNEYNYAREGQVYREDGINFQQFNYTLSDIETLKPNHKYRVDLLDTNDTPTLITNDLGEQVPIFSSPYLGLGVNLYKDGELIAAEYATVEQTATPILIEDQSFENIIEFKVINNDDENVDIYYDIDLSPGQIGNIANYKNKIENLGTRNTTEKIRLEVEGALDGSTHILYIVAKAKDKTRSAIVDSSYILSGTSNSPIIDEVDQVNDVTETTVFISWQDQNDPSDKFRVYYRNLSTAQTSDVTEVEGATEYTFENLIAGNVYRFYVSALFSGAWSPYSSVVATTTPGLIAPTIESIEGTRTVTVSWQDPNLDETGQLLQYGENNFTLTESTPAPIELPENVVERSLILPESNVIYKFRMKAFNEDTGEFSDWSDEYQYAHVIAPQTPVSRTIGQNLIEIEYEPYETINLYEIGIKPSALQDLPENWEDYTKSLAQATTDQFRIAFLELEQETEYDIRYRLQFTINDELVYSPYAIVNVETIPPFELTATPTVTTAANTYNSITLRVRNNENGEVSVFADTGDNVPTTFKGPINTLNGTLDVQFSNLPNELTPYQFSVAVNRADGSKLQSNYILYTESTTDFPAIGIPQNFRTVSNVTDGTYRDYVIGWAQPATGNEFLQDFQLEYRTYFSDLPANNGGSWSFPNSLSIETYGPTSLTRAGSIRTNVNYVTYHAFRVRARNTFGKVSDWSSIITFSY